MSERKSFPASLVDPVKIRPGATITQDKWVFACFPGKHSQRMCLKKKKEIKVRAEFWQNKIPRLSDTDTTQIPHRVWANGSKSRGSGGQSHGDGDRV